MYWRASKSLPRRVTLAVFSLLLVAIIAAQSRPADAHRASIMQSATSMPGADGLLTTRLARLAFARARPSQAQTRTSDY